jgi:NAD(P)-dependent dehydrogenase (short-subunit alcohol dehydrogenase family)
LSIETEKKIALVTGGNSGIGYSIAKLLKEKGCDVTIAGRDLEKIETAAADLGVGWKLADMRNPGHIRELALKYKETGIDYLVNSAGIAQFIPIEAYCLEFHDELFHTNVRGPLLLISELLPYLEKRQGSISTITSTTVKKGSVGSFLYAATKGAVEAFTRNLALEFAPRNVRINAVAAGPIETPIFSKAGFTEEAKEALLNKHQKMIPMGRRGLAEEVAHVVVAQLEASFVTGSIWDVDGGYTSG